FCRRLQRSLEQLLQDSSGLVRLIFKDRPLAIHPGARAAHEAARCAGAQGRYWEYHDRLFTGQPAFGHEDLLAYASALGLDRAAFNAGGGRFFATSPVCPHEEGPLAEGWLEGDTVVCPWHGYDFELTTGRCRVDDDLAVAVYPVRVNGTAIEVDVP